LAGAVTFWVTLLVYAWTMPPTVTLEDAGELAVAADYLGVPHQPGYPSWTLLAWFFQWVFGFIQYNGHPNPAWGVSFMSACFGAAAAGLLALLVSHSGRKLLEGLETPRPLQKGDYLWMLGAVGATVAVCLLLTVTGAPSPLNPNQPVALGTGALLARAFALGSLGMALLYVSISVFLNYLPPGVAGGEWRKAFIPHGRVGPVFLGLALGLLLFIGVWTGSAAARNLAMGLLVAIPALEFLLDRFGPQEGARFPATACAALLAVASCLLFAFSPTTWSQSNIVEVYSLNTFFMTAVILCTYVWLWHPERDRLLYLGAFLFGLGLTNHLSLLFLLPFLLLIIACRDTRLFVNAVAMVAVGASVMLLVEAAQAGSAAAELRKNLLSARGSLDGLGSAQLLKQIEDQEGRQKLLPLVAVLLLGGVLGIYARQRKWMSVATLSLFFTGLALAIFASPFKEEIGNVQNTEGGAAGRIVLFTLGVLILASPLLFLRRAHERFGVWAKLYAVLGAVTLGLSFYLYMAFASEQNPPMNWSYARTFQGFMHSVRRGQYEKIDAKKNLREIVHQLNMGEPHRQHYLRTVESALRSRLNDETMDARLRFKDERLERELERIQARYAEDVATQSAALFHLNKFRFFHQMAAFFFQPQDSSPLHKFSLVNQYSVAFSLLGLVPFLLVFRLTPLFKHWLGATVVVFGFLTVVFLIAQYPNLDIQDLFIKRVQYIQAYGVYAVWIGYGALALLFLAWRLMPVRTLPLAGAGALALAMPAYELRKDATDPLHLQTLGASNMRGHDFGWQFGYYQLEGGPGIDRELAPGEPPRPDPSYPPRMEDNAIFFGGTDPGRFVPTYMIYSANVRPDVYLITQNALADNTYMNVMRDLYGEKIWIPAQHDTNDSFREYITKVQTGEIDAGAELSTEGGKVSVSGVRGVMEINAILSRKLFDRNKDRHAFYVEESYPIPWMYPYLTPHGLILKLNREPTPLTADLIRKDFEFWRWYIARLKRNPGFDDDVIAQKTFSKLRSAIAGLYAARGFPRQAEEAFRQAMDLYPLSPEAAMRLALVYIQTQRIYDAQVIAERLLASDPGNKTIEDFLRNTSLMKVTDRQRKALETQIRVKGLNAKDGMRLVQIYGAMGSGSKLASISRRLLAAKDQPLTAQQLMEINAVAEANRQYKLQREVLAEFNRRFTRNHEGWIELAVVELRDHREKGREKAMADCVSHLVQAVQIGGDRARQALREEDRLSLLRESKVFQSLVQPATRPAAPAVRPGLGGGGALTLPAPAP
jgi:tetratricopeptide (TPR) repeat protein